MKDNSEVLRNIERTLHLLHKVTCCKLDEIIIASGGSPTLYNTVDITVVAPGNSYSSPEAHSIAFSVVGGADDVADITANGSPSTVPVGFSDSITATTEFTAGQITVEPTSTASVIVTTITA